jgi:hypothetical protein
MIAAWLKTIGRPGRPEIRTEPCCWSNSRLSGAATPASSGPSWPTPGQNRKRPIFGTVNLRTGAWHYHLTDRKRSVEFIAAVTEVLTTYPVGRIHILVDNGSTHTTSKAVQQWLETQARLQRVSLPSYAGHKYNPTEKLWWQLKDAISANRGFKLLAELDAALRRHFASLTPQDILRLINSFVARQAQAAVAV